MYPVDYLLQSENVAYPSLIWLSLILGWFS
jgi:hypothetical protein